MAVAQDHGVSPNHEPIARAAQTIVDQAKGNSIEEFIKWICAAIIVGFLFYTCGGGDCRDDERRADTKSEEYLPTEAASPEQIRHIQGALGEEYPISKGLAVRSRRYPGWYYVGASFYAKGVGQQVGVWIISGPKDKPGSMFSVDGFASEFSGMGEASRTKLGASSLDEEARALKAALK